MHYIMFSIETGQDQQSLPIEVPEESELKLIHFGDFDRRTKLYILEGSRTKVQRSFQELSARVGTSCCSYIGEGDVPFDIENARAWAWREYVRLIGLGYMPTVSL